MTNPPKSIIRIDDGAEFLLNEKTGQYYIDCPKGVDITKHLMMEYPYESLINPHHGGFFKVRTSETEAELEAIRRAFHDKLRREYSGHGDLEDD